MTSLYDENNKYTMCKLLTTKFTKVSTECVNDS